MSSEAILLGVKQAALDAGAQARPDAEVTRRSPFRKAKIMADNGITCTVQLIDDKGQPIKDADGNPVTLTRVPKFPADDDTCLLWIDTQGVPYVLNASGGSCTFGITEWGLLQ